MADQDDGKISETAAASSLLVDGNETITADQRREDDSGAAGQGERVIEGGQEEMRSEVDASDRTPAVTEAKMDEAAPAREESPNSGKDASQESTMADHASLAQVETSQTDAQSAPAPPPTSEKEEPTATPQTDTEPTLPSATLKAASIHASSTIHRTASPAYSQSSVTSTQGKESVASPSLAAPKKFSTVNINKKFLGKTGGAPPAATSAASSQMGNKESGLGLVNLSGEIQSSERRTLSINLSAYSSSVPNTGTAAIIIAYIDQRQADIRHPLKDVVCDGWSHYSASGWLGETHHSGISEEHADRNQWSTVTSDNDARQCGGQTVCRGIERDSGSQNASGRIFGPSYSIWITCDSSAHGDPVDESRTFRYATSYITQPRQATYQAGLANHLSEP
jgi:hypothetical protein